MFMRKLPNRTMHFFEKCLLILLISILFQTACKQEPGRGNISKKYKDSFRIQKSTMAHMESGKK